MSTRNKAGFTIIELLIVAAIIGLLSAVVLQSLNAAREKSRNATRLSQIDQINKALELSATGGQNKLPYSGSAIPNLNAWRCLGLGAGPTCAGVGYVGFTAVNTAIESNIAGGVIPKDPSITANSTYGDYYMYNSNTPAITVGGQECNGAGTTCPAGTYLSWVVEGSNPNCGRGKKWQVVPAGMWCVLRIGDTVAN